MHSLLQPRICTIAAVVATALTAVTPLHAADLTSRFSLAGFGTVGAVYHEEDDIIFRRDNFQPGGAESGELDFATDSRLGVQLIAGLTDDWQAILQGTVKLTAENDWAPQLNWAVLKYSRTDSASFRIGRLNLDLFTTGDSRDVGFAALTVRPPLESFGRVPAQAYEGADAVFKTHVGPGLLTTKLYGGELRGVTAVLHGTRMVLDGSPVGGLNFEYEIGNWAMRVGGMRVEFAKQGPTGARLATLRAIATPQAQELAQALTIKGRDVYIYSLDVVYDRGPLHAQASLTNSHTEKPALSTGGTTWLQAGYRLGAFTPYLSWSEVRADRHMFTTGLPDALSPEVALANSLSRAAIRATWDNQDSLSAGLRYDFRSDMALKFQVDRVHIRDASVLSDTSPTQTSRTFPVASLALDFVF
jgi:hypothetical protein